MSVSYRDMCGAVIALVVSVASGVQSRPDFSGSWILDSPSPAPPNAPLRLVVEQPIMRTNVRGEPMPPRFLRITIRRERASGATEETYLIGITGGTVGGVVDKSGASRTSTTRLETRWLGDTLVFATITFDGLEPRTGDWSERREQWSLAPAGQLRVEIVTESRARRETQVFLYRRN